ncbi:MAG: hypothetical protein ACQXXF_07470 [Thermoplasmatota archaeon]
MEKNINEVEIVNLTKNILMESEAFKDNDYYNPELYYLVSLYIIESLFDFYSEDLFKFLLFSGVKYFKTQKLTDEDKQYLLIFEKEIKNWNLYNSFPEMEKLFIELLKTEKKRVVESIKKDNNKNMLIEDKIFYMVKKIREKSNKKIKFDGDDIFNEFSDLLDL